MTLLEVRDHIRDAMIEQGCAACNAVGACCYRTSGGKQCGVGVLISSKAYTPDMEGTNVTTVVTVQDGAWVKREGRYADDMVKGAAIAKALTDSGIPASSEMLQLLASAQDRHDLYLPHNGPWEDHWKMWDPHIS